MGFEIISETKETDLKVVFDQENKIFMDGNVVHAYKGKDKDEIKKIYSQVLTTAGKQDLKSKFLSLIGKGTIKSVEIPIMHKAGLSEFYVYPIAFEAIQEYLSKHELNIYLNLEDTSIYKRVPQIERELFADIQNIVDEEDQKIMQIASSRPCRSRKLEEFQEFSDIAQNVHYDAPACGAHIDYQQASFFNDYLLEEGLDEMLRDSKPITFGQYLSKLIIKKGENEVDVYKRAQVDRRLYSNIINKKDYQPKKNTVILFALALKLDMDETIELLSYAGYSFSNSRKDQVLKYCIRNRYYNILCINAYLYDKSLAPILTIA